MAYPGKWTLEDILTLSMVKGVNSAMLKSIVERRQSISSIVEADLTSKSHENIIQQQFFDKSLAKERQEAIRQIDACEMAGARIVSIWDNEYPVLLREIPLPPVLLFVRGILQHPDAACTSFVGTRKCSVYGKLTAERFTEYFVRRGIVIVSGMAMGIDTICHKAAIRAGGITYAVIASGIDCINPGYAKELADKIVDSGGAIISEYKCGTTALPGYFPQRNRIISGLSKATIVVEAPKKSGALITANFAFDQQRDVYAIPGNINSEKSAGCNLLIKISKASIALSPEQVCEDMGLNENERDNLFQENIDIQFSNKNEEAVFSKLTYEPLHIDALAADCSLDISNLLVSLLNLELKGFVRQLPGKYYIRS